MLLHDPCAVEYTAFFLKRLGNLVKRKENSQKKLPRMGS